MYTSSTVVSEIGPRLCRSQESKGTRDAPETSPTIDSHTVCICGSMARGWVQEQAGGV